MTVSSRQLAAIVGPALLALASSEALNMKIYALQTAPVVYLNGAVLFVAGLALVRAHNSWRRDWTVLVTLSGWAALLLGLYRMFFPAAPQAGDGPATYAMLAGLFLVGAILTMAAYLRRD